MRGSLPGSQENQGRGGARGRSLPGSRPAAGSDSTFSDGSGETTDPGEAEFLLEKQHSCPICGTEFTTKMLRAGKAFSNGMDMDLRPRFRNIDVIKYWVVECPVCGYAEMYKLFGQVNKKELPLLKENKAGMNYDAPLEEGIRSYAEAYRQYKSVLRCNLIRGAKSSRRAYSALCTAWLLRGWRESIEEAGNTVGENEPMCKNEEDKFITYAMRYFRDAEEHEDFPLGDFGESTYDYLMAALNYKMGNRTEAQKYVFHTLQDRTIKQNLRVKAEDLRELLRKKE